MHNVYHPSVLLYLDVFSDHHIGAQVEGESDNQSQTDLSDNFEFAVQTFLVFPEHFDVIIQKSQRAEPYGGYQHQNHVDVMELAQQQAWNEYGHDNDDSSHCRHSHLVDVERINGCVTLRFGDLLPFQHIDEILSEDCRNQQGKDDCHQ